jgi:hypothetical protein
VARSRARRVLGRAPGLPLSARSLGDGRSAWKPSERGTAALVFDDRTGAIVGRCAVAPTTTTRDLGVEALAGCTPGSSLLVAGTVRFAPSLAAADGSPPSTAVALELRDGVYPAPPACFSEARKTVRLVRDGGVHVDDVALDTIPASAGGASWQETGARFIAWHCAVAPRADGRWSGRIAIVASSWTIGSSGSEGRVCRYASASVPDAIDANIASAGVDEEVGAALLGRNFLVVRGSDPCPRSPPTEQHQP